MAWSIGPSIIASSTDFFLPKPGFLEFIWIFSSRNHLKINISHILNPNLTKYIPLNPLIKTSPTTPKAHSNSSAIFSYNFNLIFSEKKIIQYFKNFCTASLNVMEPKPIHPSFDESFPKTPRTRSEASQFCGSHNYKTKQTTFLHR